MPQNHCSHLVEPIFSIVFMLFAGQQWSQGMCDMCPYRIGLGLIMMSHHDSSSSQKKCLWLSSECMRSAAMMRCLFRGLLPARNAARQRDIKHRKTANSHTDLSLLSSFRRSLFSVSCAPRFFSIQFLVVPIWESAQRPISERQDFSADHDV